MMDNKIAVQGQTLSDLLTQRLATTASPSPVAWVYDSNSDLHLRIMLGGSSPAAVLKFELQPAPVSGQKDGIGANQRVYTPHMLKVGFDPGVQASATATIVTAVATNAVTINGTSFAAVASGATLNNWNVGADDTASAANLAAAINGSVTAGIAGVVSATSALGVVTIRAIAPGTAGNYLTLTKTGAPITVTGAGFLAGGLAPQTSEATRAMVMGEVLRIGCEVRIYSKAAIDTTDLSSETNFVASFKDFQFGLLASV